MCKEVGKAWRGRERRALKLGWKADREVGDRCDNAEEEKRVGARTTQSRKE